MQIQDGSGKGYWVKVDDYNRIYCYSTTLPEISYVSTTHQNAFSITTPVYTFNSTNEHPWLWIRNNNPNLMMFFSAIIYSYNGGDTNHNRIMVKKVYPSSPEPTDRYNEANIKNLTIGSLKTPQLSAYSWNGSGDGMEVDMTGLENLSTSMVPNSSLTLNEIEAVNLEYNATILFTYKPEEIGTASISTKIYFNHRK